MVKRRGNQVVAMRLALGCALPLLSAALGCKGEPAPSSPRPAAPAAQEAPRLPAQQPAAASEGTLKDQAATLAQKLGRFLATGQFDAAYQLASRDLRRRMTREQFAAAHPTPIVPPREAPAASVSVRNVTVIGPGAPAFGFPPDVPAESRRAAAEVSCNVGRFGDSEFRQYTCRYLLLEEEGQLKLASFKYGPK